MGAALRRWRRRKIASARAPITAAAATAKKEGVSFLDRVGETDQPHQDLQ